jgi:hypothetical protein
MFDGSQSIKTSFENDFSVSRLCCENDQLDAHPEFENWWLGIDQVRQNFVRIWMK